VRATVDLLHNLASENKRLKRELTEAQQRVRALETSRWNRLNPRERWRRRRSSPPLPGVAEKPLATDAEPQVPTAIFESFRNEIVADGAFTEDWFLRGQPVHSWEPLLRELEARAARILEIGSFEGMSACYLLWRLPDAKVTCIDTFEGGIEQDAGSAAGLEERFDTNVARVDASRVRKLVGESQKLLPDLIAHDEEFDFVFVDGSHLALDVLVDASLSWKVLAPRGVLLFDDYDWATLGDDALLRPGPAIDAFLTLIAGKYELVFAHRQVAIRKLAA
jgi:hypothetical protein